MKTILILLLLTASSLADWTDNAIRVLTTCNTQMDAASRPLNIQAILAADYKFGSVLKTCRSERMLSQLSSTDRFFFERQLDLLAQSHIRRLDIAMRAMERRILAEEQASQRYDAHSRHEDIMGELQAIEDALRCWR